MKNFKITPQKSDATTQIFKNKKTVSLSVEIAIERTNTPPFKIENLVNDVLEEFKGKDINLITKAIRNGSLGAYGRTVYVLQSFDALSETPTFTNITGNLPAMPVYDAVIDVDDSKRIVIGTDLGIWVTENGGTTWEEANDGLARVPVFELRGYEWRPWEGMTIYAGTHGRGYFKTENLLTNTKKINKKSNASVKIYPNPSSDKAVVSVEATKSGMATYSVVNINGQEVLNGSAQLNAGTNNIKLNVSALNNGYYFVSVTTTSGEKFTGKLIKN